MPFKNKKIIKILDHYKCLWALRHVSGLAQWDLNTYMPQEGAAGRGEALAKVATLSQTLFLDKKFVRLIQEADQEKGLNDQERGVVRVLKRDLANYQKLPPEFLEEFERVTNRAHIAWREAKAEDDFKKFAPFLEKIADLVRRKADYLGYEDHPYDALIDEYEEGWTTSDLDDFFFSFRNALREIIGKIKKQDGYDPEHPLKKAPYDRATMEKINGDILGYLRFDPARLRLDASPHPFTQGLGNRDVRITTWYGERDFASSVSSTIHEFGHALYELQSPDDLAYTPIGSPRSLGLHESQSRFWENMVGRSMAFCERFTDSFKRLSGETRDYLEANGPHGVWRYFNMVKPGPVRVEADEVTYHFHVMIRYYIEKGLASGNIKVKDLPEIWNTTMERYLGVVPRTDAEGVLQDIHWSMGAIGYFPTYSIGTFLTAMWRDAMEKEFGCLDEFLFEEDSIPQIQEWLRGNIHQYGGAYPMRELLRKSLGRDFSPEPMLAYLRRKFLGEEGSAALPD